MSVSESEDTKSTDAPEGATSTQPADDARPAESLEGSKPTGAADDARFLDAEGRHRPRFVLDFPLNPDLDALVAAFERGDFRGVNAGAASLREKTDDATIRAACDELLLRIRPDPLVKALLGISVFLFVALVAWSYFRDA